MPCCALEIDAFKEKSKSKSSFKRIFDDSNSTEEEVEKSSQVFQYSYLLHKKMRYQTVL